MATTGITGRQIRDGTVEGVDLSQQVLDTLNAPLRVGAGTVDLDEALNFVGLNGVSVTFEDDTNTVVIDASMLQGATVFNQTTPTTTWLIIHSLGKYPSVTLVDNDKKLVYCDIQYISETQIEITTSTAFSGYAFLNSSGSMGTHVHRQLSSAAMWIVDHPLGKYPSVTIVDSADNIVYGDVQYMNNAQIKITMSAPFSGSVFLN